MHLYDELVAICGEANVLDQTALSNRYHHIWKMDEPLQAAAVVLPSTTEEVAAIMEIGRAHV